MPRFALLILTLVLAFPAAAPAQKSNQDGVFVDPDSPTSKEYAIPTEEARRDASGVSGGGSGGGSGGQPPLFGVGVDSDSGKGKSDDESRTGAAAGSGSGDTHFPADREADAIGTSSGAATTGGDASGGLTIGGIALAVLLLGAGIALALKRRQGWTLPPLRRVG